MCAQNMKTIMNSIVDMMCVCGGGGEGVWYSDSQHNHITKSILVQDPYLDDEAIKINHLSLKVVVCDV